MTTKAQRMEEWKTQEMIEFDKFKSEYQSLLLDIVGRYTKHLSSRLSFGDEEFVFRSDYSQTVRLKINQTLVFDNFREFQDRLDTVAGWLETYLYQLQLAKELDEIKTIALSKLTAKERSILGI